MFGRHLEGCGDDLCLYINLDYTSAVSCGYALDVSNVHGVGVVRTPCMVAKIFVEIVVERIFARLHTSETPFKPAG